MEDRIDDDVLQWYQQFTHDALAERDHSSPNFFVKARKKEISEFRRKFEGKIPDSYILFLEQVGEGRLSLDANGRETSEYENSFFSPAEVIEIVEKKSSHWSVYEDFVADNETPFFYIGDNAVLVFREGCGGNVYFPYLDDLYAETFGEFLRKLMNDVEFYNNI